MRNNIFIKFFIVGIAYFFFTITGFAAQNDNTLSEIQIYRNKDNSYTLDMFFNSEYTGKAFVQNKEKGSYFVFLPQTSMPETNLKVIYKNKKDKKNIQLDVEEKLYSAKGKDVSYIKLSVDTKDNSTLKLVSSVFEKKSGNVLWGKIKRNGIKLLSVFALCAFALLLITRKSASQKRPTSYTTFRREKYVSSTNKEFSDYSTPTSQKVLPKLNISKSLKPAERNTFDCFELPFSEKSTRKPMEFKSTLKQTSNLMKSNPSGVRTHHTNPLYKTSKDNSDLRIPSVDEIIKREENTEVQNNNGKAELISILNITPTKGFYLTTVDDTLALFGFINDNIFLLKKFHDLSQINLQARYYDKNGNNDIYIVRLDTYKAMVEISDTEIKELAKL